MIRELHRDNADVMSGINALTAALSSGNEKILTMLEWGFGSLCDALDRQNSILEGISYTLSHPRRTRALENFESGMERYLRWRKHLSLNILPPSEIKREKIAAKGLLQEAINEDEQWQYLLCLAQIHILEGAIPEAIDLMCRSRACAGDNLVYTLRLLGRLEFGRGDYHAARHYLEDALVVRDDHAPSWYDLAVYNVHLRANDVATSAFVKAFDLKLAFWYIVDKDESVAPFRAEIDGIRAFYIRDKKARVGQIAREASDDISSAYGTISELELHSRKMKELQDKIYRISHDDTE